MDAVLGLSVTPSAVGLVLVEGQDADGATVDREAFEILPGRHSSPLETSEQAAAAVLRTEAIAATRGHRLHSIGVTWSDDADVEATLLLKSLTECGFENVVPVRLPEATEALAWGVAEVIGQDITAVCLVEPETVIVLIVHTRKGAVQTAVNRSIDSEEALVRWLSSVFTRADWRPEALVVVGSGGDVDAVMPRLEHVLSVPVFAPAEAELALARGAALASTHTNEFILTDDIDYDDARSSRHSKHNKHISHSRWPSGQVGPLAMLVAGAVTFVVSVSVAVSLEIASKDATPPEPRPASKSTPEAAAAANPVPLAPPRRVISVPIAQTPTVEPPTAPPVEVAPPPVEIPVTAPQLGPDGLPLVGPDGLPLVGPDGLPSVGPDGLPLAVQAAPIDGLPPAAPVLPPAGAPIEPLPPEVAAQVPQAQPVPSEPSERPGILHRIRERLSNAGGGDEVQTVQQAPAAIAAAEVAAAPPPEAPAPVPAEVPAPAPPTETLTEPAPDAPVPPTEVPPLPPQ